MAGEAGGLQRSQKRQIEPICLLVFAATMCVVRRVFIKPESAGLPRRIQNAIREERGKQAQGGYGS